MGTRADFYVGRGEDSRWLGSIAWDGYPEGIDDAVLDATSAESYEQAVEKFFHDRNDVSRPLDGWPWPWETSHTTDYAYAFDASRVWVSEFGGRWMNPRAEEEDAAGLATVFPVRGGANKQRPLFGAHSGVVVIGGAER